MANIHQTLKRVAALYEDLIGTREEITRCVEELQRWQQEQREWRREWMESHQALLQETREVLQISEALERRRHRHSLGWTLLGAITLGVLIGFISWVLLWSWVWPPELIDFSLE